MASTAEPDTSRDKPLSPLLPSLLLLPPPPRPAARDALSAAYRPPLEAALSKLRTEGREDGAVLIVAVAAPFLGPHPQQPHKRTLSWPSAQTLVAGLYGLISVICARLGVPTELHGGPGSVDARVALVDHEPSRRYTGDADGALAFTTKPAIETNNTVLVDLASFAAAYHPWHRIYHANTEEGNALLTTYLRLLERRVLQPMPRPLRQDQLVMVPGGLAMTVATRAGPGPAAAQEDPATELRRTVCVGGTFDHLHPGHKLLLHAAVLLLDVPDPALASPAGTAGRTTTGPCRLIVGITGDELLRRKKYAELVQPWDLRAEYVIEFLSAVLSLSKRGWGSPLQQQQGRGEAADGASGGATGEGGTTTASAKRGVDFLDTRVVTRTADELVVRFRGGAVEVQCVVIHDMYGPTATREDVDALVVSGETRAGGKAVNEKRAELGWHALEIFEVDVLDAEETAGDGSTADGGGGSAPTKTEDFASKISSTAIRKQKAEAAAASGSRV